MFVLTKQAVLFIRPDGERFAAPNGYMGDVPDWVAETKQFKRQVADGKIVATESITDKAMQDAGADKPRKGGKRKDAPPAPENGEPTESITDKA